MIHGNKRRQQAFRMVRVFGIVAMTGLAAAVSPASAQNVQQVDLSAGYLNVNGSMHGVNAQVSAQISRRWSLVGEFDRSSGQDCQGCDPTYHDLAGLGGVRFAWHPSRRIEPFWQVLVGGLHSVADGYYAQYCCGLGRQYEEGFTVNYLALQPGGGVTVMVTPRFGIRAQADFQFAIPDQSQWEGMSTFPRVVAGGVIRLGSAR